MQAFWREKSENVVVMLRRKAWIPGGKLGCALQPWRLCVVRTGLHWTYISTESQVEDQTAILTVFLASQVSLKGS